MSLQQSQIKQSDTLAETSLPRVLASLYRTRFHGVLALENHAQRRRFSFYKGSPALVESSASADTLERHLMSASLLSAEDYRPVAEYAARKGVGEATALLALNRVDPLQLLEILRLRVRNLLLDSMDWQSGRYTLFPESLEKMPQQSDLEPLLWDPPPIIHQGLIRQMTVDQMLDALAPQLQRFPQIRPDFNPALGRLQLDSHHAKLLSCLAKDRPLADSLGPNLTSPPLLAALWVLDALGSIEFRDHCPADNAIDFEAEIELIQKSDADKADAPQSAPSTATPADAQEADTLRAEVDELRASLGTASHYEILGVGEDASSGAIRKAYFGAAKRFHPDTLARLGLEEIKREASEVFSRVAEAFDVLSDPNTRHDYDAPRRGEFSNSDAQRVTQAETLYRKGEVLLRMGDFKNALDFLAPAVEVWPEEAAYQSALGWALYKQAASDPKSAREHLSRAVELDPDDAVAHFRLGMVFRALGENRAATDLLERAKELEPPAE